MRRNLLLRLGALVASLLAAGVLMLGPAATPARALSPASRLVVWLQRLPRQVVIDGHCRIVESGNARQPARVARITAAKGGYRRRRATGDVLGASSHATR